MLEALFSNATLIVPYWSDAVRDPIETLFDPADSWTCKHFQFAKSKDELKSMIHAALVAPPQSIDHDARLAFFNRYLLFSRATSNSESVARLIERLIKFGRSGATNVSEIARAS